MIPAAIGLGSSIFSGIKGKGAAKKQEKLAAEQYAMLKPLLEAQVAGGKQAIQTGNQQIGQGAGYLTGAQTGFEDLKKFWQPLMTGNRSAIDAFLAPERRAINQGAQATAQNLYRMAPRGGGRVSALATADVNRQGALNDLVFGARREGANQMANLNQSQGQLGLGQMGVGASVLGQGLNAGGLLGNIYGNQIGRADAAGNNAQQLMGQVGTALGGFLTDIFKPKGRQGSSGANSGGGLSIPAFTQGFGGGPVNV
jgi:hypothetical protein